MTPSSYPGISKEMMKIKKKAANYRKNIKESFGKIMNAMNTTTFLLHTHTHTHTVTIYKSIQIDTIKLLDIVCQQKSGLPATCMKKKYEFTHFLRMPKGIKIHTPGILK